MFDQIRQLAAHSDDVDQSFRSDADQFGAKRRRAHAQGKNRVHRQPRATIGAGGTTACPQHEKYGINHRRFVVYRTKTFLAANVGLRFQITWMNGRVGIKGLQSCTSAGFVGIADSDYGKTEALRMAGLR